MSALNDAGRARGDSSLPEPIEPEEPEFEDEPPGAILLELRPRRSLVVWGALNAGGVGALGLLALSVEPEALGQCRMPLAILWVSLPASSLIGFVLSSFLVASAFTPMDRPARAQAGAVARRSAWLHAAALLGWILFAWPARAGF